MKTRVFYAASSDVTGEILENYKKTISLLKRQGLSVSQVLFRKKEFDLPSGDVDFKNLYESVIQEINRSDIFVADITYPSGGVGYQVYHAFYQKKPTVVLYSESINSNPSMIMRGIKSKKFLSLKYDKIEDLETSLPPLLDQAVRQLKVRFHLVLDNNDYTYIEKEARSLGVSKTEFLKSLISKARQKI